MTVQRSKSVAIDKAKVLVSNTFSRTLSYNAMTQHKNELNIYYAKEQFHKGSPVAIMSRERSGKKSVTKTKSPQIRRSH